MADPREQELEAIARELGGGWRIERGVMPVVVLTLTEARAVLDRAVGAKLTAREVERLIEYADEWESDGELVAKLRQLAETLKVSE